MATPTIIKRILRSNAAQWTISIPIALYFQMVRLTGTVDRPPFPAEAPLILALWHGRIAMSPLLHSGAKPLIALISGHRDGQIISKVARLFNILTATGSSSQGGMRAVRELVRRAQDGHSLLVTPDGPRGPRMRVDRGIVDLARLTGLPIMPAAMSARRGVAVDSWDRLLLPSFFTTIVIRWGEPIHVGVDDDAAEIAARLEAAMIDLQNLADKIAGRPLIAPG